MERLHATRQRRRRRGGGWKGRGGGGDGTTQDSDRTPKRARKANNTNDHSAPTIVITPGRAVDGDDTATADVGATGLPLFWDSPEAQSFLGSASEMATMFTRA